MTSPAWELVRLKLAKLAKQAKLSKPSSQHSPACCTASPIRSYVSPLKPRTWCRKHSFASFQYELQNAGGLSAIRDLRPWLVRIAWNLSLDRKRRVQPDQMDDLFAASLGSTHRPADEVLVDARYLADVLAVIERLPHKERDVLLLSAVEELTTVEIAAILGKSESSIRSLLFRARTHMQERLNKSDRKGGLRP